MLPADSLAAFYAVALHLKSALRDVVYSIWIECNLLAAHIRLPLQEASRPASRDRLPSIRKSTVYPDRFNSAGRTNRIIKRGNVAHCARIEEDQVRVIALANPPSPHQAKPLRRQRSHFANGLTQREQLQLPAIDTQHTRKCSPETWVRQRIVWQAIGANHCAGMPQNGSHVLF